VDIAPCTKADFDQIVSDLPAFWGDERTLALHHPMLVSEFGNTAYVIREGALVIAYLFGFFSQTTPTAYVHLIGVRRTHQQRGLGRRLYDHFRASARAQGCTSMAAITTPTNAASIAFHRAIGMELLGTPNAEGIPVVRDYSGPGKDRVVFHQPL
jgi:GNAT superfamily N-acetyltransferase